MLNRFVYRFCLRITRETLRVMMESFLEAAKTNYATRVESDVAICQSAIGLVMEIESVEYAR